MWLAKKYPKQDFAKQFEEQQDEIDWIETRDKELKQSERDSRWVGCCNEEVRVEGQGDLNYAVRWRVDEDDIQKSLAKVLKKNWYSQR